MRNMKKSGRYDTAAFPEAQFEQGSRGRVLKNLLGIKRKREMDKAEAVFRRCGSLYISTPSFVKEGVRGS